MAEGYVKKSGELLLSELFPGEEKTSIRDQIIREGKVATKVKNKDLKVAVQKIDGTEEYRVLAVAAVSRDPGLTSTYIDSIQDFKTTTGKNKEQEIAQFWQVYAVEGLVNNGVNKVAAILSGGGRFVVYNAKKGKKQKAQDELQAGLNEFVKNVNNAPLDGVVTGSRGVKSLIQQGTRQALVEGDWFGRTIWSTHDVPGVGPMDLPMTIQSITTAQIEAVKETAGTGIEAFYWKPPTDLLKQIQKPTNKDIAKIIKQFINDSDVLSQLKKNKKALLDPALLMHVKHRGVDSKTFGESFLKPALGGIAFKRSVEALDLVTMESLINRLTIVSVGAGGKESRYSEPEFAAQRAALMQTFFDDPGPNMTIIWQGDDIKVDDVGAHSTLADTDNRHQIGESKVKQALGLPDALLSGTTADGKAAGWAATIGTAAELEELQNSFAVAFTMIGERIAAENGFTDVQVSFVFNNSIMADKSEEWNQAREDYIAGAMSIRTYLSARGIDPDAEFQRQCEERGLDPSTTTWKDAFMPIEGLAGQGAGAPPGKGGGNVAPKGKPTQTTKPQKKTPEKKGPVENK